MYEGVKIHSNMIHEDDFLRLYLQLQETTSDGRNLLHDAFLVCTYHSQTIQNQIQWISQKMFKHIDIPLWNHAIVKPHDSFNS